METVGGVVGTDVGVVVTDADVVGTDVGVSTRGTVTCAVIVLH